MNLKFRAWDKENQRWMTPEIEDSEESEIRLDLWGNLEFTPPWWEQGDNTIYTVDGSDMFDIMQSTSFKDADDADIFEGDIVKIDDDSNGEMKAKVVFEQGAFGLVGIDKKVSDIVNSNWNDDFLSIAYFSWEYEHLEDYLCNVVIIGNIYENPELLEVAE